MDPCRSRARLGPQQGVEGLITVSKEKLFLVYAQEDERNEAVTNFSRYVEILRRWDAWAGLASVHLLVFGLVLMLFSNGVIPAGELEGVEP